MTQHIDVYDTNGTVTLPSNLVSTNLAVLAIGAGFAVETIGAYVNGQVAASLFPLTLVIGEKPVGSGGRNGGDGYSGGGAGQGPGGGGSTGVLSGSTLLIEAGGQDGQTLSPGTDPPGGSGGGFASNTPPGGAGGVGDGAGSGGSQGGTGGDSDSNTGGTGSGGGTNGNANSGATSGAGVGSGGLSVPGYAASFAGTDVIAPQYGPGPISGADTGTGYVAVTYDTADAPNAPTGLVPSTAFLDVDADGITLGATYSTPGADTGALLAVAVRLKIDGGTVHYWNGTDFTSTSPVWVTPSTGLGVTNGEMFTVDIPAGLLADGHTYAWGMACQEGFAELDGPFSANTTFTGAPAPSAVITSPASTVTTRTPNVTWTPTTPAGSQTDYRYVIYGAPTDNPGAGAPILDTGVVASASHNFTLPGGTFDSVDTYYGYLQITETGGQTSAWIAFTFTVQLVDPAVPSLGGSITNEPVSGCPAPLIVANDNSGPLAPAVCQADILPTFPFALVSSGAGQNNQFTYTPASTGIPETFTMAPGVYTAMTPLLAQINAAIGSLSGERFDTIAIATAP